MTPLRQRIKYVEWVNLKWVYIEDDTPKNNVSIIFCFFFFYFLFMFLRPFIKIEEKDINFHWILDYFWNLFSFMVKIMKPNLIFQKFIHLFLFLSLCWHIIILAILLISCCCQMIFFYFILKPKYGNKYFNDFSFIAIKKIHMR